MALFNWRWLSLLLFITACLSEIQIKQITFPILHGEGPHWDIESQSLYFVDTFNATVLKWTKATNTTTSHKFNGDSLGFVIPVKCKKYTFIVCRDRYINLFEWNGLRNNTGTESYLTYVDPTKQNNQFNDGKVDAKGRLWGGTLTRNSDLSVTSNGGSLYLINGSCGITVKEKISPVSISNGLDWSRDYKRFFYIDSETRRIDRYQFNLETGDIGNRRTLFDLNLYSNLQGIPDGMTIDADDNLWVALYGGKSVLQISSTSGKLLRRIEMPATGVTSLAFGGPNLDILYVTTSRLRLTGQALLNEMTAGSVFAIYGLGVRGNPANNYKM